MQETSTRRPIPAGALRAILAGEPAPDIEGCDTLDLSVDDHPDLPKIVQSDLDPILRSPVMKQVRHLVMAEEAVDELAGVLAAFSRGQLRSIRILTTEAYCSATDRDTTAHIAAAPSAEDIEELSFEYTQVWNLGALAAGPFRKLRALRIIGGIEPADHMALGGPAPGFRALRHLTLTPDRLDEEAAKRIAASPDLAGLAELDLPFVNGSGFDWAVVYEPEALLARLPPALEAIQALPGLEVVRITCPFHENEPTELSLPMQYALLGSLWAKKIVLDERIFDESVLEHARETDTPALWEGAMPYSAWRERLHRGGLPEALGMHGEAPSVQQKETLDEIARALKETGASGEGEDSVVEGWGEEMLLALLGERGVTRVATTKAHKQWVSILYDPARYTRDEAAWYDTLQWIDYPDLPGYQEQVAAMVASIGVKRACELHEQFGFGKLTLRERDGQLEAELG